MPWNWPLPEFGVENGEETSFPQAKTPVPSRLISRDTGRMKQKATAIWQGSLKEGAGTLSTGSGVLAATPYSFKTRFEGEPGTNPEELIGAAHAGCFSMAFSMILGSAGFMPTKIETTATISLEPKDGGFAITTSHLDVVATIDGIDDSTFQDLAGKAKAGCPVSKVLNTTITMDARLG
jgi:osmotically inducible protein OsmC